MLLVCDKTKTTTNNSDSGSFFNGFALWYGGKVWKVAKDSVTNMDTVQKQKTTPRDFSAAKCYKMKRQSKTPGSINNYAGFVTW